MPDSLGHSSQGSRGAVKVQPVPRRQPVSVDALAQVDRPPREAYVADLHAALGGRCYANVPHRIERLLTAIRQ
jgi:hypothetical protein